VGEEVERSRHGERDAGDLPARRALAAHEDRDEERGDGDHRVQDRRVRGESAGEPLDEADLVDRHAEEGVERDAEVIGRRGRPLFPHERRRSQEDRGGEDDAQDGPPSRRDVREDDLRADVVKAEEDLHEQERDDDEGAGCGARRRRHRGVTA